MKRRENGIVRVVDAEYRRNRGLTISVHDLGPGASITDDEYECWYTVSPSNIAAFCELVGVDTSFILARLRLRYGGPRCEQLLEMMGDSELVEFSSFW